MSHVLMVSDLETIARVSLARSDDPGRYCLQGVYLDCPKQRVVATNGKMLAVGNLADVADADGEKGLWASTQPLILPPACVSAILGCYSKRDGILRQKRTVPKLWLEVEVPDHGPRTIVMRTLDALQTWPEMDGTFPDYGCVFPKDYSKLRVRDQTLNPEMVLLAKPILAWEDGPLCSRAFLADSPAHPAWAGNTTVALAIMPIVGQTKEALAEYQTKQREKLASILA